MEECAQDVGRSVECSQLGVPHTDFLHLDPHLLSTIVIPRKLAVGDFSGSNDDGEGEYL
jgi:hypothetical protein